MNKEVSLPSAKLLKEKGFDEICQKWYSVEGSPYYQDELDNHRRFVPAYECEAPTIAEAVMWLYEKYGIWISCEPYDVGRFKYIIINELNLSGKEITGFNSPTEAYEAAIEYTLNNLI